MSVLHAPLRAVGCTLECLHVLHAVLSNSMQWCVDCGLKHVLQTILYHRPIFSFNYIGGLCMFHVQYVWYMMSFREQEAVCCMPLLGPHTVTSYRTMLNYYNCSEVIVSILDFQYCIHISDQTKAVALSPECSGQQKANHMMVS